MAADDLTPRSTSLSGGGGGATTLTGLTDTPAGYGVNGQVLTTNGVNAATWSAPAAAYALDPSDWVSIAGVQGVGTGTALAAATYPDLADADAGQALGSGPTELSSGALRIAPGVATSTMSGIDLGTIPVSTDGVSAVRVALSISGRNVNNSINYNVGLWVSDGTDTATAAVYGCGFGCNGTPGGGETVNYNRTGANRGALTGALPNGGFIAYALGGPAPYVDLAATRDGATGNVDIWIGQYGGWRILYTFAAATTAAAHVMLLCRSNTTSLTVGLDVTHILPAGALAQATPPRVS